MRVPAFSLIDALVAMLIALTALAGLTTAQHAIARHRADAQVTLRAWRLLESVARLPVERLAHLEHRVFDARGQPAADEGFFDLQVSHVFQGDILVLEGTLSWSLHGQPFALRFSREEWYPYEPSSL